MPLSTPSLLEQWGPEEHAWLAHCYSMMEALDQVVEVEPLTWHFEWWDGLQGTSAWELTRDARAKTLPWRSDLFARYIDVIPYAGFAPPCTRCVDLERTLFGFWVSEAEGDPVEPRTQRSAPSRVKGNAVTEQHEHDREPASWAACARCCFLGGLGEGVLQAAYAAIWERASTNAAKGKRARPAKKGRKSTFIEHLHRLVAASKEERALQEALEDLIEVWGPSDWRQIGCDEWCVESVLLNGRKLHVECDDGGNFSVVIDSVVTYGARSKSR